MRVPSFLLLTDEIGRAGRYDLLFCLYLWVLSQKEAAAQAQVFIPYRLVRQPLLSFFNPV